jgi:small subunit ribosomal protein S16
MGAKKAPFYRIVATDAKKARDGEYIEQIGYYNPVKNPAEIKIDAEIAKKWLAFGAQPTDTVRDMFIKAGIIEKK